jgi:malonate decarboxylase gamma subunit
MNERTGVRGRVWFQQLTGPNQAQTGDPESVLAANAEFGGEHALVLCVVPNLQGRFPCAQDGQVGLEEAYALAHHVRATQQIDRDRPSTQKRPILAIVDVKSQAYGRREETAGIFLAAAASADAYASARMAGHPVITLIVGHAFSGGFLTHGYQANRILALDDGGVVVHAMHKEAAARVTRRSVAELERLGREIPPMSYDVRDFAKLGLVHQLLHVANPAEPTESEISKVRNAIQLAIADARRGPFDLSIRWQSAAAQETRKAGLSLRLLMERQWKNA